MTSPARPELLTSEELAEIRTDLAAFRAAMRDGERVMAMTFAAVIADKGERLLATIAQAETRGMLEAARIVEGMAAKRLAVADWSGQGACLDAAAEIRRCAKSGGRAGGDDEQG
jgi:hypothetical protein